MYQSSGRLPKVYQLFVRAERLAINVAAARTATIASVKADAFSALTSPLAEGDISFIVSSVDDFELSRAVKGKNKQPTGSYEVLNAEDTVGQALTPWESVFVQFRDDDGKLLPVDVSLPSLLGEEEEEEPAPIPNKGKRKAED